jgi:hypothetical protein
MHVEAARVMSPRDDAPCRYVNSAMLIAMKKRAGACIRSSEHDPTHGFKTVRLVSYRYLVYNLQSRLRTTCEYRDAFGGVQD